MAKLNAVFPTKNAFAQKSSDVSHAMVCNIQSDYRLLTTGFNGHY
jgi:hypothetical protein